MMMHPNPALYLSPEMVAELALGQDAPLDIASKYGFTAAEFAQLQSQSWFGEMVYRKREELQASGITFVVKAQMMAEEMWQDIYTQSKTTDGMRMEHRLEAAKQLTDIAGLKPKAAAAQGGPAFMINIQLPPNPQGPSVHVLETAKSNMPAPMVIDLTPEPQLPPMPAGYKVPDFKVTHDLVGVVRPAEGLSAVPLGQIDPRALPAQTNGAVR